MLYSIYIDGFRCMFCHHESNYPDGRDNAANAVRVDLPYFGPMALYHESG